MDEQRNNTDQGPVVVVPGAMPTRRFVNELGSSPFELGAGGITSLTSTNATTLTIGSF